MSSNNKEKKEITNFFAYSLKDIAGDNICVVKDILKENDDFIKSRGYSISLLSINAIENLLKVYIIFKKYNVLHNTDNGIKNKVSEEIKKTYGHSIKKLYEEVLGIDNNFFEDLSLDKLEDNDYNYTFIFNKNFCKKYLGTATKWIEEKWIFEKSTKDLLKKKLQGNYQKLILLNTYTSRYGIATKELSVDNLNEGYPKINYDYLEKFLDSLFQKVWKEIKKG